MTDDSGSISPTPRILYALQNETWSVKGALSELIDNSFGIERGNADHVWIMHDKTNRTITVLDDGVGMSAVSRLFRLGDGVGMKVGDIGKYGTGGTLAILWLARVVDIWTLRSSDRKVSRYKMEWKKIFTLPSFDDIKVPNAWEPATEKNTPRHLLDRGHGTYIHMHLLQGRNFQAPVTISEIVRNYAPGLRSGKIIEWVSVKKDKVIERERLMPPEEPTDLEDAVEINGEVAVDGKNLPIKGRVVLGENIPVSKSVVSFGLGHRVIFHTKDCFSSPDGTEVYQGAGVCGWIDLGGGWADYLSLTKDSINNDDARDALMRFIFEVIRPLLEKSERATRRLAFDELQISLTDMLNAESRIERIKREKKEKTEPKEKERKVSEDNSEDTEPPKDNDEAASNLEIVEMSDAAMEGQICTIDVQRENHIIANVNYEHSSIKSALQQSATDKRVLTAYVMHPLAAAIVDNPSLLKATFRKPSVIRDIERFDGRQRERYVLRRLMDRVILPLEEE